MLTKPVVIERDSEPDTWSVEQTDRTDGDVYLTVFYGPDSEERARAYAEFLEWRSGP